MERDEDAALVAERRGVVLIAGECRVEGRIRPQERAEIAGGPSQLDLGNAPPVRADEVVAIPGDPARPELDVGLDPGDVADAGVGSRARTRSRTCIGS